MFASQRQFINGPSVQCLCTLAKISWEERAMARVLELNQDQPPFVHIVKFTYVVMKQKIYFLKYVSLLLSPVCYFEGNFIIFVDKFLRILINSLRMASPGGSRWIMAVQLCYLGNSSTTSGYCNISIFQNVLYYLVIFFWKELFSWGYISNNVIL